MKVRLRHYTQSSLTFTEVKQKTNKGRTLKQRIQNRDSTFLTFARPGPAPFANRQLDAESRLFVNQHIPLDPSALRPVLWVGYTRITLVSNTSAERLTLIWRSATLPGR